MTRSSAFFKKHGAFLLVLVLVTGLCFLFSCQKSGMHIDELYTYGLSNSHYAPFIRDVAGGELADKTLTREDVAHYLEVEPDQRFDFGSVYYNQVHDVHPPLYYWLINIASSLTPGVFSKWTGLVLNYLILIGLLAGLYMLALQLFDDRYIAAAVCCLYGCGTMGLSTALMIRMYILLTALTVWLAYLVARFIATERLRLCPLIGGVIFLGMMTQYYFVLYAFFLCCAYLVYALCTRRFKAACVFAPCALAGVALMVAVYPAVLDHLFADKLVSGGNAVANLLSVSHYLDRAYYYVGHVVMGMIGAVTAAFLAAGALLLRGKKTLAALKGGAVSAAALVVVIPAFIALAAAAVISPVKADRYVYNIAPCFALAVGLLLHVLARSGDGTKVTGRQRVLAGALLLALSLCQSLLWEPDYLYPEQAENAAILSPHTDAPCLYLTDFGSPVSQDLLLLEQFPSFFVTPDPDSPALDEYLAACGDARECVVFVDVSEFWSSGFDPDVMIPQLIASTPYSHAEQLFCRGLSDTYLLTK